MVNKGGSADSQPTVSWIVVGALGSSLLNFRGELLRLLVKKFGPGIAASDTVSPHFVSELSALGVSHVEYPISRSGLSPSEDLNTLRALAKLFKSVAPSHVLAYTIKPVIWGGIALWARPEVKFTALVTGLGYVFEPGGLKRKVVRAVAKRLYQVALRRADAVIFQNPDNRDTFVAMKIVDPRKCHVVNGSGVEVSRYAVEPLPTAERPRFLLIARLLGDKGVREYVESSRILAKRGVDVEVVLAGPVDPSPDGIELKEVESWVEEGAVTYLGELKDVRPAMASAHVYVLPSYHEGMPRTVLEAMSMGRPILTTDVSGCRETVVNGENGWLVPKGDAEALAERMQWFVDNRDQWERMGLASRAVAEDRFDVHKVNRDMLQIMGLGAEE